MPISHRLAALLIAALAIARADAATVVLGTTVDQTLVFGGQQRHYRLHVPFSYAVASRAPLVVALHASFNDGAAMEGITGFSALSERYGFIVAYPDAVNGMWFGSDPAHLDLDAARANAAFVGAVIDRVESDCRVDASRVYATGYSAGGGIAILLGQTMSDRIAAFAPVAAAIPENLPTPWPARPISSLWIDGTADSLVPYSGGVGINGVRFIAPRLTVAGLASHDGCSPWPTVAGIPDIDWLDWSTAASSTYGGGAGGSEVVLYTVNNGGHTWPGSVLTALAWPILGATCMDFDASDAIWRFFSRHPLAANPAG